ncbi:hypothetical protein NECAME_05539 [Necator americanus]|uniref:7TM GPCR serpentine receptor class x (Srx) domain-containing protein n=1 Tax=Necator americanus TaxID=51031 RepID=W2SG49_NECAM|nr:hypothetical protein NECAME_05539 [Necator americanus]ETN68575.1 hypothetical protein NECAME_05539 [Necator americanus]
MTIKFWLGILLGVVTLAGLILSSIVMFAVVKLSMFKRKSPIYVISAANILCDCIQLIFSLCYLVPSIVSNSWLFKGDKDNDFIQFLGAAFLFCWYYGSVAQILMAVNRVVVVCMPHIRFFSFKNVLIIVIFLFPVAILVAWISQYVTPCCKFSFDHVFLSYSYISKGDTPNYSNMYIDLPLNSSSSAICAICYTYIIFFVWKMTHLHKVDSSGGGRRVKEYRRVSTPHFCVSHRNQNPNSRYALQFCAISIFYLTSWVAFRVFPVLIGASGVEYFIVIPICVTINSSANAVVYITSNTEVHYYLERVAAVVKGARSFVRHEEYGGPKKCHFA